MTYHVRSWSFIILTWLLRMLWLVHHVQLSNRNNYHAACWKNSLHSTRGRSSLTYLAGAPTMESLHRTPSASLIRREVAKKNSNNVSAPWKNNSNGCKEKWFILYKLNSGRIGVTRLPLLCHCVISFQEFGLKGKLVKALVHAKNQRIDLHNTRLTRR